MGKDLLDSLNRRLIGESYPTLDARGYGTWCGYDGRSDCGGLVVYAGRGSSVRSYDRRVIYVIPENDAMEEQYNTEFEESGEAGDQDEPHEDMGKSHI